MRSFNNPFGFPVRQAQGFATLRLLKGAAYCRGWGRMTEFGKVAYATGILLAILALLPLRAEPTDDEKKALHAAGQSYKDGAFDLCNDRVAALLKKFPKTELAAEAELLQARALYQLGRSDAALAALNLPPDQVPENLRADTLFWQAESLLDLGQWPDAEQKYRALLALKDTAGRMDAANLGLAWALFKQGREADALSLIQALIKDKASTPAGRQAQLLLAKVELAKKQFKEAIAGLEALLAAKPEAGLAFETEYWLGEAYAANGQPDQAVTAYEKITGDLQGTTKPQAFPKPLVARAFLGLGRAEHALHQDDPAALAYEQAYKLTENEATRLDAFRAYLESARSGQQLPEAVAKLQEFAKTSDSSAPAALFAIGSVLAENKEDDKAIGILGQLSTRETLRPHGQAGPGDQGAAKLHQHQPRPRTRPHSPLPTRLCLAQANPGLCRGRRPIRPGFRRLGRRRRECRLQLSPRPGVPRQKRPLHEGGGRF